MATLANLRTRARIRADQDNSTFPTDTQYLYLINEAMHEVWYDLIQAGWPVSFSSVEVALPSTTEIDNVVSLGVEAGVTGNVAFIRGVYYKQGGTYHELPRLNEGERPGLYSTTGVNNPSRHDVRVDVSNGIGVEFLPYTAGTTVRIEYVKEPVDLADDADTWRGPARSDELIVIRAAAKACRKEGNDQGAAQLDREYLMLLQAVQNMASWANMRHASTIRDVGDPLGRPRLPGDFDVYGPDY